MHKTVLIVSRFIFAGTALLLFLALFVGVVIGISRGKEGKIISRTNNSDKAVLAAQNDLTGGSDREVVTDNVVSDDARPLLIKKYLEKYQSPLLPYADLIFKLSETYGFDYYWRLPSRNQICVKKYRRILTIAGAMELTRREL
jgi:hypothetical protein